MKKMDLFYTVLWTAVAFLALYLEQGELAPFFLIFAILPVFFETTERRTLKLRRWVKKLFKQVEKAPESPELKKEAAPVRPEPKKEVAPVHTEPKKEVAPVRPEPKKEVAPVHAEAKKEAAPIRPEPKKEVAPVRPEPKKEVAPVRPEPKKEVAPVRPELAMKPAAPSHKAEAKPEEKEEILLWNDFLFRVEEDGTLSLTGYRGEAADLTIPAVVMTKRVVNILPLAFENNQRLQEVSINSGIAGILMGAFRNCVNLQKIHIPESVTTIGKAAFDGCGVTTVEERVFTDNIPEEIRGMQCYYHSYQQYMIDYGLRDEDVRKEWRTVKKTVRKLNITVIDGSYGEVYCKMNDIPHTVLPKADQAAAEAVFEYKVLENNSVSIAKYKGNSSSVVIPATLGGKPVKRIGYCAFQFCTILQKVVIPEGVTIIGPKAFEGCSNLTDVVLPESLTIIDKFAFWRCWKLKNINVPQSLQRIEYLAFGECEALREFKRVRLRDGIQVDNAAFHESYVPATYESNGVIFALQEDGTLHITGYHRPLPRPYQQLSSSIRGHRLVKILPDAFRNCQEVIEMVIPEGVREIGSGAFQGCPKLRLIAIPASVTYIGEEAIPDISSKEFEDEQAAHWADLQYDPWARKEYGLYDPIIVESKPGKVKVVPGSYAESWCKQHGICVVYK